MRTVVLSIGLIVFLLGAYLWQQYGFIVPIKFSMDGSKDSGVPILLIIFGISIFFYGIFMESK